MPDISQLSSQQYAYLLLRRLQRTFRASMPVNRYYCLNYFGEVFESPGVEIQYENYTEFCELMDQDIEYCASKGLNTLYQISSDPAFNGQLMILQQAFAAIGCTLTYDRNNESVIIETPDGNTHTLIGYYLGTDSSKAIDDFTAINARLRATDVYWQQIQNAYELGSEPLVGLDQIAIRRCGEHTTWGVSDGVVYIAGTGEICQGFGDSLALDPAVFLHFESTREAKTFVLGAGVDELQSLSFSGLDQITIVCLRAENDAMTLASDWHRAKAKTAITWTIYTDNLAMRNFDYGNNATITFYPLSEWEGV